MFNYNPKIRVAGELRSLKDVTEEDFDKMSLDESEIYFHEMELSGDFLMNDDEANEREFVKSESKYRDLSEDEQIIYGL